MRHLCILLVVSWLGCLPKPPEPSLKAVEPPSFDGNLGTDLALLAEGLIPPTTLDFDQPAKSTTPPPVVSAFIEAGGQRLDLLDVLWVDATRVTGRLAGPVAAGVYDVHLVEPRGRELVLPAALEALDCADVDCVLPDGGMGGVVTCTTMSYRDRDGDGFGSGTGRTVCGAGWVPLSGDCNDRDPLTFPGATEVCNGLDDNCNQQVDEGRCTDAGWTAVDALRSPANDFLASASFDPGSLWITAGAKVFIRRGELGFAEVSSSCPMNMKAVWSEPGGDAEVGGGSAGTGRIAEQSFAATGCSNQRTVSEPPVAMVGFQEGSEYQYVAVLQDGRVLRWHRGETPTLSGTNLPSTAQLTDLHGTSPTQLFAVGSSTTGLSMNRRPAIWAFQSDGGWREETVQTDNNNEGRLLGVWALSGSLAVAVGENGLAFTRSVSGWRAIDPDTSSDLTSVRAFSTGRFYVSTSDGRVRRRSAGSWQTVFRTDAGTALNDLAATSEEDLWAVGNNGVIGRGPH